VFYSPVISICVLWNNEHPLVMNFNVKAVAMIIFHPGSPLTLVIECSSTVILGTRLILNVALFFVESRTFRWEKMRRAISSCRTLYTFSRP